MKKTSEKNNSYRFCEIRWAVSDKLDGIFIVSWFFIDDEDAVAVWSSNADRSISLRLKWILSRLYLLHNIRRLNGDTTKLISPFVRFYAVVIGEFDCEVCRLIPVSDHRFWPAVFIRSIASSSARFREFLVTQNLLIKKTIIAIILTVINQTTIYLESNSGSETVVQVNRHCYLQP